MTANNLSDASTSDSGAAGCVFQYYKAKDGWRWRLKGANHEIICWSEAYKRKKDCLESIKLVQSSGKASVGEVESE
jgi:uncharacterized protein YegP (UPF0339 family)